MSETYGIVAAFAAGKGAPQGTNLVWVTSERTIFVFGKAGEDRNAHEVTPAQLEEFAKRAGSLAIPHRELLKVKVKSNGDRSFALIIVAKDPAGGKRKLVGSISTPPWAKDADDDFAKLGLAGMAGLVEQKARETYRKFAPHAAK